jgi:hypothetical protein
MARKRSLTSTFIERKSSLQIKQQQTDKVIDGALVGGSISIFKRQKQSSQSSITTGVGCFTPGTTCRANEAPPMAYVSFT